MLIGMMSSWLAAKRIALQLVKECLVVLYEGLVLLRQVLCPCFEFWQIVKYDIHVRRIAIAQTMCVRCAWPFLNGVH